MKKTFAVLALLLTTSASAIAADANLLGTFGSWSAYSYDDNGSKVCYMTAAPEKQDSNKKNVKRGDAYFYVTHWSAEKNKNVASAAVGYPIDENSRVTVAANGTDFGFFAKGETAWAKDQTTDDAVASAIQKGSKLTVSAKSKRGTETTDTYNLKGSGDAYKLITKECGF